MINSSDTAKPFLRWAGGKKWLIKQIDTLLPPSIINYYEPFLGGGSVFFHLASKDLIKEKAYLLDNNGELINAYIQIQKHPQKVMSILDKWNNDKTTYDKLKKSNDDDAVFKAARFIYLNKTSYNGLYRVNSKGEYNVPFGHKTNPSLYDKKNILSASKLLRNAKLLPHDFSSIKENIKSGDFVFVDPPYTVAHGNNGFIAYNQAIFSWEDQKRLKSLLVYCSNNNISFMMTNANHESIYTLFSEVPAIKFTILDRNSLIGGRGAQRKVIQEIVATNY